MLFRLPLLKRLTIQHKKLIAVFSALLVALLCWLTIERSKDLTGLNFNEAYGKLPLQFEPNEGQAAPDVEFLTRGSDYTLFLKQTEVVLSLRKQDVRLKVLNGNPAARISALDILPGKVNHFIGKDTAKWRTDISTYQKVKYESVYPGIDLIYYGNHGRLEYDFIVAPGTDPQLIQLSFPEAKELRIDQAGALIAKVEDVELRQAKPLIYQETATGRRIIDGNYILKGAESFAFQIDDYDHKEPLIIDPTLAYSTLLGTTTARSIAVDAAGNAYITGSIDSDVYVFKLNPTGTALVYATLIGGTSDEEGGALAVDSAGNVYVTGGTDSTDFPTVNAMQSSSAGAEAFVTKINPSGSALIYSTYLGGASTDAGTGIALNSAGNAFVLGFTFSTDFPVHNAAQPTKAPGLNQDIFVSKFNSAGNALVFSTYLGGGATDFAAGLALDSQDNVYLAGRTDSVDFPTTSDARQPTVRGSGDGVLTKLNSAGNALLYSSYHGGSHVDECSAIAVHSDGTIFVTGSTLSTDFPVANALQPALNSFSFDAFVTRFDSLGKTIIYSTYLGGDNLDFGTDLVLDSSGNAYITGHTFSANFPLVQPLQRSFAGFRDVIVAKLNPAGSALTFSTYLGSDTSDTAEELALHNGSIFVIGDTFGATNFPVTAGAFRQNHFEEDGSIEGFVFRIDSATNTNYYSISGRVSLNNQGLSGILITLSGSTSRTVRTDFDGRYSFHLLAEGGTYTIAATPPAQFTFIPPSHTFANLNSSWIGADFIVPRPPNDNFVNAQVISNTSGVINGTTAGATRETGEPLNGGGSVWYRWQASATGPVILNYIPGSTGMLLEVFTGSTVNSLTNVSARFADCESLFCNQSAASFQSVAGTVYFIRVAGAQNTGPFGFSFSPGGPTISGRVKNVNGRSLSGIPVRTTLVGQNKVATVTTTDNGYSLVVPSGGNYSVVAVRPPVDSFVPVQLSNLTQDVTNVDFTASSPTVNVFGSMVVVNGTSTGIGAVASGVGFSPQQCRIQGSLTVVFLDCFVPIFGDYTITPTSTRHTFDPSSRFFSGVSENTSGADFSATQLPSVPLRLMMENPGPVPDLVVALDAALLVRDPFAVVNPLNWLNNGPDKNTRLVIFLQNFQPVPGELPSEVVVNLARSEQSFDVFAEDVRPLANTDLTQVTFRLPSQMLIGECTIKVRAHGETTNSATLRIGP